jgi:hypothetical protein
MKPGQFAPNVRLPRVGAAVMGCPSGWKQSAIFRGCILREAHQIIQGKPGQKVDNDPGVGLARIRVANSGGKEFDETPGCLVTGGGNDIRKASA